MLHIGVLGYNQEHGVQLLKKIIEGDQNSRPCKKTSDRAILKDNTYYIVINNNESTKGVRFDQLIVANDDIMHSQFVRLYVSPCLAGSCVPDEFLVQVYKEI